MSSRPSYLLLLIEVICACGLLFFNIVQGSSTWREGPAKDQHGRMQSVSSPWSLWMAVRDIDVANGHIFALHIQRKGCHLFISLLYDIALTFRAVS